MTERALQIDKAVLTFLAEKQIPLTEVIIHAGVQEAFAKTGDVKPSLNEMDSSFARLNAARWINGLPSRIGNKMKWNINDAGRDALLEM